MQAFAMVAIYAIASISVAVTAALGLLPSLGWWAIGVAWLAANLAAAGAAIFVASARRRQHAATDRMVADLRSVLVTAADIHAADAKSIRHADRRVA